MVPRDEHNRKAVGELDTINQILQDVVPTKFTPYKSTLTSSKRRETLSVLPTIQNIWEMTPEEVIKEWNNIEDGPQQTRFIIEAWQERNALNSDNISLQERYQALARLYNAVVDMWSDQNGELEQITSIFTDHNNQIRDINAAHELEKQELNKTIAELSTRVENIETESHNSPANYLPSKQDKNFRKLFVSAMTEKLKLQQQVDDLTKNTPVTSLTNNNFRKERAPKPEKFSGDMKEWEPWKKSVEARLRMDGWLYETPQDRLDYVLGLLKGTPWNYVKDTSTFADVEDMVEVLEGVYGDAHRPQTARFEYDALDQGKTPWKPFIAEFKSLAKELCLSDETMVHDLKGKVSNTLKKLFEGHTGPIRSFADLYAVYDNLSQRQEEKRRNYELSLKKNNPAPFSGFGKRQLQPKSASTSLTGVPTLPANRQVPAVIPKDRNRVPKVPGPGNPCYNCGKGGHFKKDCTEPRRDIAAITLHMMKTYGPEVTEEWLEDMETGEVELVDEEESQKPSEN
jgi:hypothetical protein